MDWRDIPSLSALKAFEAAARLGSHSAAARELNVTHAAVAQHVRSLEAHFGQSLMQRQGRGVVATAMGQQLAGDLTRGFGEIAAGVRALTAEADGRPMSITTTPTFAENWLMPRLVKFWADHPEIALTVVAEEKIHDLRSDGHAMAIRYGRGDWPGVEVEHLYSACPVIVAHPDLAGLPKGPAPGLPEDITRLQDLPWLFDRSYEEFMRWLRENGLDPDAVRHTNLGKNTLVLAACRSGAGVSVQPYAVVERDIADGRLVVLAAQPRDDTRAYYLVTLPGMTSPRLKTFTTWLKRNL